MDLSKMSVSEFFSFKWVNEKSSPSAPPAYKSSQTASKPFYATMFKSNTVGSKELSQFTRQLAATLRAGLLLTEALEAIVDDSDNAYLSKVLQALLKDIRSGLSFSQSLARHPKVFSASYVSIIKAGEASGRLDKTVESLAKYLEDTERLKEKVKSAITYPTFVIGFAVLVVGIIVFFLIPKFKETFTSFHATLPLITRIVMGISEGCVKYFWVFLLLGVILFFVYLYVRKFPKFKHYIDVLKINIPVLGKNVIQKAMVARFCRTLGFLLNAGVGMSPSLEITLKAIDHSLFGQSINFMHQRILGGAILSSEIKAQTIFPKLVSRMVAVGERSGQIPQMLLQTADYYEDELEHTLHKLTTLLEPALIVFIGVIVLIVVLALYLPIFQMATVIK